MRIAFPDLAPFASDPPAPSCVEPDAAIPDSIQGILAGLLQMLGDCRLDGVSGYRHASMRIEPAEKRRLSDLLSKLWSLARGLAKGTLPANAMEDVDLLDKEIQAHYEERWSGRRIPAWDGPIKAPTRDRLMRMIRTWPVDTDSAHHPAELAEIAASSTGEEKAEGVESNPFAAAEGIMPSMLSAPDIANHIKRNPKSVASFLTRFSKKNPDCRVEVPTRRQNEPAYLYRLSEVWPALESWLKGKRKR